MKSLTFPFFSPQKSTNVRAKIAPGLLRGGFQALSSLAPPIAARWAEHLFLTPPPPHPLSANTRALLARADDRFTVKVETRFGQLEESRVSVALWGQGPTVYLLHGWGGRGTQWAPFIEPLVSAGMTAIAIDAPRHGESAAPRTSLLHFAAALTAVVASVGPPRAVIGHSLGGAASVFAMRSGLDAERLVLIGAPHDPSRFLRAFAGNLGVSARLHDAMLRSVEGNFGFHWNDVLVTAPHERPEVPVLVVHDRDDLEVPYAEAERVVAGFPRAELVTTSGLGHRRILRDREVVAKVARFVR